MSDATNDNGSPLPAATPGMPDPHGQAALLLVESLMHGLLDRAGLSISEAVEIVQRAIDVQHDISDERSNDVGLESTAALLLRAIAESVRVDDPTRGGAMIDGHGPGDGATA